MVVKCKKLRLILSLLLCFTLMVAYMPLTAFSSDNIIYVSGTSGNDSNSGISTAPVKTIEKALELVEEGGTIQIVDSTTTEQSSADEPLVITKEVMIMGGELTVNKGGIILGANATFKNISISFINAVRNAIIANGYTLTLENVKSTGTYPMHLFCGSVTGYTGSGTLPTLGSAGTIVISGTNNNVGDIFAGSLSEYGESNVWEGSSTITISSGAGGTIGNAYAHGATEPRGEGTGEVVTPDSTKYTVKGNVTINLSGSKPTNVDGATGGTKNANVVVTGGENLISGLALSNLKSLTISSGTVEPASLNENADVTISSGAELDLSTVIADNSVFSIGNFTGGGRLAMGETDRLSINGTVTGTTEFQTTANRPMDKSTSGTVEDNYSYIDVTNASGEGTFTFTPYETQTSVTLEKVTDSNTNIIAWTTSEEANGSETPIVKPSNFDIPNTFYTMITESIQSGLSVPITCELEEDEYFTDVPLSITISKDGAEAISAEKISGEYGVSYSVLELGFEEIYSSENSNGDIILCFYPDSASTITAGTYTINISVTLADNSISTKTITLNVIESGSIELPTTLTLGGTSVISTGTLQDDGVANNASALYEDKDGNWSYDSTTNVLNIIGDTTFTSGDNGVYADGNLNIHVARGVTLNITSRSGDGIYATSNVTFTGNGIVNITTTYDNVASYGVCAEKSMTISGVALNVTHSGSYEAIVARGGALIFENAIVIANNNVGAVDHSVSPYIYYPIKVLGNSRIYISDCDYGVEAEHYTFSDTAHIKVSCTESYVMGDYEGDLILSDESASAYYWRDSVDGVFCTESTSCEANYRSKTYFEYIGANHVTWQIPQDANQSHYLECINDCSLKTQVFDTQLHTYNSETGKCESCQETLVAQVNTKNNTYYFTKFEEAISDWANCGEDSTLILLQDCDYSESIHLSDYNQTLDLNGHTWDLGDTSIDNPNGFSFILKDSKSSGKLISSDIPIVVSYGTLELDGSAKIEGSTADICFGENAQIKVTGTWTKENAYKILIEALGTFAVPADDSITLTTDMFALTESSYLIGKNEDGSLYSYVCEHIWDSVTENHTATIKCINGACTESVTLTAPTGELTYDGNAKEATINDCSEGCFINGAVPTITYAVKSGETLESAPKDAGTYTASITLGEGEDAVTATVEFEIEKVILDLGTVTSNAMTDTLDMSDVLLSYQNQPLDGTLTLAEGTVLKYGTHEYHWVFTPTDTTNYKQLTGTVEIVIYDTIAPVISGVTTGETYCETQTITVTEANKENLTVTINGEPITLETDGTYVLSGDGTKQTIVASDGTNTTTVEVTVYSSHPDINTDGACDVCETVVAYCIAPTSRLLGTPETVANISMNPSNGYVMVGDSVTVTAPEMLRYTFKGWYLSSDIDATTNKIIDGRTAKETSFAYTFTPGADMNLVAVYESAKKEATITFDEKGNFTVFVNGKEATGTENEDQTYTFSAVIGDEVTITVTDESFINWCNDNRKIVTTETSYTFTVTGDVTLNMTNKATSENTAMVEFVSAYNQVIASQIYTSDAEITPPDGPSKMGYIFKGWSVTKDKYVNWETTQSEIQTKITEGATHIIVVPVYEQDTSVTYTVTVYVDDAVDDTQTVEGVLPGTVKTVSAPTVDGKVFLYWTDEAGTILGYDVSYGMKVNKDIVIKAVYGEKEVEKKPVIAMTNVFTTSADGKNKLSFTATRDIPEGYTLVEHGMLYNKSGMGTEPTEDTFIIGGTGVGKAVSSDLSKSGVLTVNVNMTSAEDTKVAARGYMIVKNNTTGNEEIYYTELIYQSYNNNEVATN
uniref:hypothetical protein n=1 Tax=Agathobacter sp. TaxID=2021311 RepID=UPI00405714F1